MITRRKRLADQLAAQRRQLNALCTEAYLLAGQIGRVEAAVSRLLVVARRPVVKQLPEITIQVDSVDDWCRTTGRGSIEHEADVVRRTEPRAHTPFVARRVDRYPQADSSQRALSMSPSVGHRILQLAKRVIAHRQLAAVVDQQAHGSSHSSVAGCSEATGGAGYTGPVPPVRSIGDLLQELRSACGGDCIVTVTYGGGTR